VAITAVGYVVLLGSVRKPGGFLMAYTTLRETVPAVHEWLGRWIVEDIGSELLPWCWPLVGVGLVAVLRAPFARPMQRWLAASVATTAGFAALATVTETLMFARFLWSLELCALALCAVGAILAGRAVVRLVRPTRRPDAVAALCSIAILVLVAVGLTRSAAGAGGHYVVLFEHGARTAMPWLRRVATEIRPGERLAVPLWFQPAAIWTLEDTISPSAIEASEVQRSRAAGRVVRPEWLLVANTYLEDTETIRWTAELRSCGYERVAVSTLPAMELLRRTALDCEPPSAQRRPASR
jgi:hypothetical protein